MNRFFLFGVLLINFVAASNAKASCGSASCPLNGYRHLGSGRLEILLSHDYINQNRIYVGSSRSFVGALPNPHDEVQTINDRTALRLQYGISDAFGVGLEVPYIYRYHKHIEDGEPETFNFSGLGDVAVTGQYAFDLSHEDVDAMLSLILGAKLPTGVTNAKGTSGETAEVTIQPGTGSTDMLAGLNYHQGIATVPTIGGEYSSLPLTLGILYQLNGKGTNDYQIGRTLMGHLGTEYQFTHSAYFLFQVNAMVRAKANVGSTDELPTNTGGTWIFASPGLRLEINDMLSAFTYFQLPVYQHVNGIQQGAPFYLQVGFSASVGLIE